MNFWDIYFGILRFVMEILRILFFPALIIFGLIYKFRGIIRFRWVPRTKEVTIVIIRNNRNIWIMKLNLHHYLKVINYTT